MIPQLLLEDLARPDTNLMVVTGAGISLASGIQTFRGTDPGAVWANDVLEKGTYAYFCADPVKSWEWYLSRFDKVRNAEPNPAHHALVEIERKLEAAGKGFLLVTQNIDGLHKKAGTKNLVEVHGAARKMRCSSHFLGCPHAEPDGFMCWDEEAFEKFRKKPCVVTLPTCPVCGNLIRAHVLWFDESYGDHEDYGLDRVLDAVEKTTVVLFVGTSFSVGITQLLTVDPYSSGVPLYSVDPVATDDMNGMLTLIQEKAEEFLPALAAAL